MCLGSPPRSHGHGHHGHGQKTELKKIPSLFDIEVRPPPKRQPPPQGPPPPHGHHQGPPPPMNMGPGPGGPPPMPRPDGPHPGHGGHPGPPAPRPPNQGGPPPNMGMRYVRSEFVVEKFLLLQKLFEIEISSSVIMCCLCHPLSL